MPGTVIYLAGPLSDGDDPYSWHNAVGEVASGFNCVNPFVIHAEDATGMEIYQGDIEAVRDSDAVLLRRIDNYEVCGAYIEAGVAGENDIPIVVWNDARSDVPEFLRWHADAVTQSIDDAVTEVANRV